MVLTARSPSVPTSKRAICAALLFTACLPVAPAGPGAASSTPPRTTSEPAAPVAAAHDAPCLYDAEEGRYRRCHHVTADGRCVHYGAWCDGTALGAAGADPPCLYDAAEGRYRRCHHVTADGRCVHFGAWCDGGALGKPGRVPCLYDASQNRHRECHHVTADGRCVHFGAWCQP